MAARALLHWNHLPAFDRFMASLGWEKQPTRGAYEHRRYTRARRKPVVLYARSMAPEHLSVMDEDRPLVWKFLRAKREAEQRQQAQEQA